jgi:hypothetical protein
MPVPADRGIEKGIEDMGTVVSGIRAAAILAIMAASSPLHASCGLHFCPRVQEQPKAASWQLGYTFNRSGFDIGGAHGTYSEGVADIRYMRGDAWTVDLHVPFLALTVDSRTVFGFANPLALAEYRLHPGAGRMLGFGLQTEIPLGDADAGLAQEHFMLMPYAAISQSLRRLFFSFTSGVSFALTGSHPHASDATAPGHGAHGALGAGSPLYVNPHEDFEWVYRVSAGANLWNGRAHPELFVSGQRVLGEVKSGAARDYLNVGFTAPVRSGRLILSPNLEVPVTEDHRFDWTVGMGVGIRL